MRFKPTLMAGKGTYVTASLWRLAVTALERWSMALSSIYTYLVASGWLSKWGTTTGCKTSLRYWSPVRFPCMGNTSSLQSWEIQPKPILSLHHKGQLAGCSLGHRLYMCVLQTLIRPSVAWNRNQFWSDQWILRHVLKFKTRLSTMHKTWSSMSVCQQWKFNDSHWLQYRWFQTVF